MNDTAHAVLMQFSQLFQMELFPRLEREVGELSKPAQLLSKALAMTQLHRFIHKQFLGRPQDDRRALVTAFLAKAIYNFATTRQLLERLHADDQLRRLCGWSSAAAVPSESTFSRAFADFARRRLPEHIHEALVRLTHQNIVIEHIARDSTAIEAREHFPDPVPSGPGTGAGKKKKVEAKKAIKTSKVSGKHPRYKNTPKDLKQRGRITQRQRHMDLEEKLATIERHCSMGAKADTKGNLKYWRGYKLHLDVADGQIPITALLSGAHVHDAVAAIPLMHLTTQRVTYLYDVMDSAYDAEAILAESKHLGHVPVVHPNGRRGTQESMVSEQSKLRPPKLKPQLCPAKRERYKTRTAVERVNARLKDEFGGRTLRVRGAAKVMAHLMFGVVALTIDQLCNIIKQ